MGLAQKRKDIQERQLSEQPEQEIGSAGDGRHGLHGDGVNRKEQPGDQRLGSTPARFPFASGGAPRPIRKPQHQPEERETGCAVEQQVREVVAEGFDSPDHVIEGPGDT